MDAEHGGRPSRLLTPDFGMPFFFFFFLHQISHLCRSDGPEERCQFGVKGRADTAASQRAFSITEIQSARGLEQCQGSPESSVTPWGPSCAPSST